MPELFARKTSVCNVNEMHATAALALDGRA
jgi:hypothetical protein